MREKTMSVLAFRENQDTGNLTDTGRVKDSCEGGCSTLRYRGNQEAGSLMDRDSMSRAEEGHDSLHYRQ